MQFGIAEAVEHWSRYRPRNVAIYSNDRIITYRSLNDTANKLCNFLLKQKISEPRIGIALSSKYNFIVSLLSILKMGKSVTVINTGLPDQSIAINIRDTCTNAVIVEQNMKNKIPSENVNLIDFPQDNELKEFSNNFKLINRFPSDEWGILFSSGTTGIPKGIERDHNSIVTELLGWCIELNLNKRTSFYIGRPVYYTGGLVLALSTLLVCGSVILNDYNDYNNPLQVWNDYQKYLHHNPITWSFFVPDQIRIFLKDIMSSIKTPLGSESILTMGSPITGEEKKETVKYLNSNIVESWGNSESLGTITDPEDVHIRPNSIGRPFLTDEMYIVNDDGNLLEPNEYGRIAGGEEAGFLQYSNRPHETNRVKKSHLIISDDIGYMDNSGYLYLCGRRQDLIVTSDGNIFLPELETKLRRIKGIYECSIVAKTQEDGSFFLYLFLVCSSDKTSVKEQINNQIKTILDDHEKIDKCFFVSELPRVPSGKVDKIKLLELIEK